MKYYFFLTVFLFGSFFIGQNVLAINSDIVINEIGAYPTSTHEWIEIWNRGSEPIDIKNWKFWENNTNHGFNLTTSSDSIVSAGEFAAICQDADVFWLDHPNFIGSVFDSSWINLTESGENIGLKDETGNFVEQFSYVSTTKYSLERNNPFLDDYSLENWQENINGNTAGAQNSNYSVLNNNLVTSTIDSSSTLVIVTSTDSLTANIFGVDIFNLAFVKINEIISDPSDGNELVELFNSGTSTVDLSGASICDSSGGGCFSLSGSIVGHNWLVADLLTDRYLNNTGDTVILKDKNNNVVDQIIYGTANLFAPEKGQSLIRKVDGLDANLDSDWVVTNKITLNSANELLLPVTANNVNSGGSFTTNNNYKTIISTTSSVSTLKTSKISTTTKPAITEPKDSVNISWKLDWPYGLDVGEMGIFSAKGSADPRGGELNFIWNFGDNTSGTGHLYGHSFASSGIYFVSVVASSTAGTISKKEFKIIVGSSFSVANADLKINSWLVASLDDMPDYIELKNNLNKPQNISGWKLKNKSGKEYEFPDNTIISASGTLKFFKSIHHLSFDKNGDDIRLTSPNNKEMDKVFLIEEKKKIKEAKIATTKTSSNWLTVRGIVTVEPKTFGQQSFYISDGTTGFQIYQYKKDFPNLKVGDQISVAGEVSEVGGVKRIKIKNKFAIDILATNKKIEPVDLKLEEINEELLGSLVKISGDITEIKSSLMYVDDGTTEIAIYFKKGGKINKQEIKEGDKVEVVGILNQGKDGWHIFPRTFADINVVGHVEGVLAGALLVEKDKQNGTTKKYITTTAGGLTALLLGFLVRARGALLVTGVKKVVSLAVGMIKRG